MDHRPGGLVSRLHHLRRALAHLPRGSRSHYLIIGFDQWSYNDNWEGAGDDASVEAEYADGSDALGNLRYGMRAWPEYLRGRLPLGELLGRSPSFGVNARLRGNGFRHDGSYLYADILRDPASAEDYLFRNTLARVRERRQRFASGAVVSARALEETRAFLEQARGRGVEVVGFLPPFAPTVRARLVDSGVHQYLDVLPASLRQVFDRASVPLFDFTSCEPVGCTDAEFIDGFHGGETVYARLLLEMARTVPWIEARLAAELRDRLVRAAGKPKL